MVGTTGEDGSGKPHLETSSRWETSDSEIDELMRSTGPMLGSSLEDAWFSQDTNIPMSSHADLSNMCSSLSSAVASLRDRILPSRSPGSIKKAGLTYPSPSYSHLQSCLNSPRSLSLSQFKDVPPLANPLSITSNSSLSSEDSLCSDGEDDDSVVEVAAPSICSTKRKVSYPALDDAQGTKFPKTQTGKKARGSSKKVREPRYSIQTRSDVDLMEDGYKWRKYGHKALKDSPRFRSYYRCTTPKCPVRKRAERARDDPGLVITTYEGTHTHRSVGAASSNASSRSSESLYAAGLVGQQREKLRAIGEEALLERNSSAPGQSLSDLDVQSNSGQDLPRLYSLDEIFQQMVQSQNQGQKNIKDGQGLDVFGIPQTNETFGAVLKA